MSRQTYDGGVLVESWDDATRTYTDHRTDPPTTRPYNEEEDAAADERLATDAALTDLAERVARIEAHLWPVDGAPPVDPTDVPTFADLGGVWPAGTLLLDGGTIWRNVSGVPLTTSPSGFPGDPARWTHLFVAETTGGEPDPDPDPGRPDGYVGTWSAAATYAIGDVVDRDGTYYRCRVAHGPEYGGTWGPPQASVWDDIGPV